VGDSPSSSAAASSTAPVTSSAATPRDASANPSANAPASASAKSAEGENTADDFAAGGDENSRDVSTAPDKNGIKDEHVGNSEVWRFNLKTDSPLEVRPRIVQVLRGLQIAENTPGIDGVEAPGGIQFDLLVPQASVNTLKKQLQSMAPKAPTDQTDSPAAETFTWYMNKSKRKLPEHKTRIVIWLSQM
jgi:hypothetical protein